MGVTQTLIHYRVMCKKSILQEKIHGGVQSIPTIKRCVKLCDLWVLTNPELTLFGLVSKSCRNL